MTVAVMKSKAEQQLVAQFAAAAPSLPGAGWVSELRREAIGVFAAQGLPHRRIEAWKYTDLRERLREALPPAVPAHGAPSGKALADALGPLANLDAHRLVFVDGRFAPSLSDMAWSDGVEIFQLAALVEKAPEWLQGKFQPPRIDPADPVTALNLAFMTDGALVKVKSGTVLEKPVLLVNARTGDASAVSLRHILSVGAGARVAFVEAHVALGRDVAKLQCNSATDLDLAANSHVTHVQIAGGSQSTHLATWRTRVGKCATYRGFQLTAGAALARNQIDVAFTGPDARIDLSGAMLGRGRDHIDTTLVVHHSTPGCESREHFKSVLDGSARAVFQGKVIVDPIAQKTDGKQMAQALMLSENAEFDSKPELEIYADDVACGHGSTAAEIDPAMLFYLRSRGIAKLQARAMLIESFVGEVIEKIEGEALRAALMELALAWLRQPQQADR